MIEEHKKTTIIHADCVTPPITINEKFKLVYMSEIDKAKAKILDITKETDKKYSGIATRDLTYCPAITLIEKNNQGKINKILMSHLAGNVGEKNLNSLFSQTQGVFSKIDEMIVCPGLASDERGIKRYHDEIAEFLNIHPKMRPQSIYYSDPSVSHCVTVDGHSGSFPYQPYTRSSETKIQPSLSEEQAAFGSFLKWGLFAKFKIFHLLLNEDLMSLKELLKTTEVKSDEDLSDVDSDSEEDFQQSENIRKHVELYNNIRRYIYKALFDHQAFKESGKSIYEEITKLLDALFPYKKRSIIDKLNRLMSCIHSDREKLFSKLDLEIPIVLVESKTDTNGIQEDKEIKDSISSASIIPSVSSTAFTRFKFDASSALANKKEISYKIQTKEAKTKKRNRLQGFSSYDFGDDSTRYLNSQINIR